ncbi:LON peptidase N-terminal domain and RING finger protein 1 [Bagarius yarrelli]|uniref:LON peptidase N-terminal domain and RING finger protein 1 n=1 Tax=Bagarius yarrelli TaxID=175774 RepID=A0A556V0V0_BAGYA|nr:LON peptidase N-terminal domain and RING finger protein 1 [Bagarius yarrelli]
MIHLFNMENLDCPVCLFLLCEPVTISCGHSFCRRCILGSCVWSRCPVCTERLKQCDAKSVKNNVLLHCVVEKCCPEETKTRRQIQESMKACDYSRALRTTEDRMQIVPDDLSLKSWRAEANMGLQRFSEALHDLEDLCTARPNWTEAYFRKGNVLLEMGKHTEALAQFHHCLKQQPDFSPAKQEIRKILDMEGLATPDEVPQTLQMVDDYLRDWSSQTNRFGSSPTESLKLPSNQLEEKFTCKQQTTSQVKHNSRTDSQSVSYLSTAEKREGQMIKNEEMQMISNQETSPLTVSDFECPLCISLTKDIPIFVCTVAFPGIPCPLHVFEPRYRLMIRRCMETGTRKFGMCSYEHGRGFADYGCMLEILDQNVLSDGRSYVETVGKSRFRVLRRGQRDGYHTADIEYLQDNEAHGDELEMLQRLHDSVYQQAREWYQRLNSRIREHLHHQYGEMPEREDNIQALSLITDETYSSILINVKNIRSQASFCPDIIMETDLAAVITALLNAELESDYTSLITIPLLFGDNISKPADQWTN